MKLHILGICGTFMAGVALLARQLGHDVTGTDMNIYPPMSDLLKSNGIDIHEGYSPDTIDEDVDEIIIGNALSRENPSVEFILNQRFPYTSGPRWLSDNVLLNRRVIAIAGTHGKTTTTSLTAWALDQTWRI